MSKKLLRAKVWFPGMDKAMGKEVKVCFSCQASDVTPGQEPLQSTEFPKGPWEYVVEDFKGPLKTGEYALVIMTNTLDIQMLSMFCQLLPKQESLTVYSQRFVFH